MLDGPIMGFSDKYSWLSNFQVASIEFEGAIYPSVENAYQAAKLSNREERGTFTWCTAGQAKRRGRKIQIRDDWESIKVDIMLDLVRKKFKIPRFRQMLLNTGDSDIYELNTWGDVEWGVIYVDGILVGKNLLGKILMQVREEIKQSK